MAYTPSDAVNDVRPTRLELKHRALTFTRPKGCVHSIDRRRLHRARHVHPRPCLGGGCGQRPGRAPGAEPALVPVDDVDALPGGGVRLVLRIYVDTGGWLAIRPGDDGPSNDNNAEILHDALISRTRR